MDRRGPLRYLCGAGERGGDVEASLTAEIYLFCLILSGLLCVWSKQSSYDSVSEVWMKRIQFSFFVNNAAGYLYALIHDVIGAGALLIPLSYFLRTLYFVSLVVLVFCWCVYSEFILRGSAWNMSQRRNPAMNILFFLAFLIPVVNLFWHWMFSFDEAGQMRRHGMFYFLMVYLFVLGAFNGLRMISVIRQEHNPGSRRYLFIVAVFPLCQAAPVITGLIGENFPVSCVAITIELLCLYVENNHRQISIDSLTGANNRNNLLGCLGTKITSHDGDLFLLMLDLDGFKQINDTYGHLEGDRALREMADILRHTCAGVLPRPYIARYGGDEFIVIVEGGRVNADRICAAIREELNRRNEARESGTYCLDASIGCVRWQDWMNEQDFIAAADAEMYRIKKARKGAALGRTG